VLPEAFAVATNWRSAVGVDGFAAAVTQACRNAVSGVDGSGGTAQFPNMGRAPSGAWAPVTNNYFDRRSGTVPPDPRAPR